MVNIFDVPANVLIDTAAVELAKLPEFKAPEWAPFVKTGVNKQRPPARKDWWQVRVVAILRTVYRLGPIGVSQLRTKYGGKMNRGVAPEHHFKGSGSIIRKALQQLEKAGFVKQVDVKKHKGRVIAPKGKSFLDKIAMQIYKSLPKEERTFVEIRLPPPRVTKAEKIAAEPKAEQPAEAPLKAPKAGKIHAEIKPVEAAEAKVE